MLLKQLREKLGCSAYEVSFLLGKHNFFVRDAENPLKTTLIDSEDTCHLAKVFRIAISQITPPNIATDNYQLEVIKDKTEKRKDRFEIYIKNTTPIYTNPIEIIEEEKHVELSTILVLSDIESLRSFIRKLYQVGFFNDTRTALEIFDECRKEENFGHDFHPRNMIRALEHYTNSKSGEPILDKSRTNLFARRLFFKAVDFPINPSKGSISKSLRNIGVESFQQAADWIKGLSYQRNKNKDDELAVFDERCGTCSTKHALLKRLADENGNTELRLMLGIFTMNAKNTPAVKDILKKYDLEYIPEAHNYLRAYNYILDYTGIGVNETKFELDILIETEINPDQITDFKVQYHRDYLNLWIEENQISYSLDELWRIREECIAAIGTKNVVLPK